MDTFFFFVPYRLVWDNWKRFMGEQRNPGDSTSFWFPRFKLLLLVGLLVLLVTILVCLLSGRFLPVRVLRTGVAVSCI